MHGLPNLKSTNAVLVPAGEVAKHSNIQYLRFMLIDLWQHN
jgi:hypothetical protein